MENISKEELIEALKLAGIVAMTAELVFSANTQTLSNRIEMLKSAVDEYNEKIYSLNK